MDSTKTEVGAAPRDAAMRSLFEVIVELSEDAIVTCDKTGRITSWGTPASRIFGYDAKQAVGEQLDSLVAGHFRQAVGDLMGFVLAGERIRHFEAEAMRPDGMAMPMALSLSPILDAEGAFIGFVAIVRDLTEQYVAQAAMAEVEARVEDGEALAHVGSWVWDVRTGAVQWSAEFYRICDVDPLEFAGTLEAFLSLVDSADRGALHATMIGASRSGCPFETDFRLANPTRRGLIEVRARPMCDVTGATIGFRGVGQRIVDENPSGLAP